MTFAVGTGFVKSFAGCDEVCHQFEPGVSKTGLRPSKFLWRRGGRRPVLWTGDFPPPAGGVAGPEIENLSAE